MILESVCVGSLEVNCYVLASGKGRPAIIIDPGADEYLIKEVLDKHKLEPSFVINTHGHYDHIACDDKFGVPVCIHKEDEILLKDPQLNLSGVFSMPFTVKSQIKTLEEGQILELDGLLFGVLHIPGHTPGGIALLMKEPSDKAVFSGDTLFYEGIGRFDLARGDGALLVKSIKDKLLILPDEVVVYPGHGPSTTIGHEKRNNPFLSIM